MSQEIVNCFERRFLRKADPSTRLLVRCAVILVFGLIFFAHGTINTFSYLVWTVVIPLLTVFLHYGADVECFQSFFDQSSVVRLLFYAFIAQNFLFLSFFHFGMTSVKDRDRNRQKVQPSAGDESNGRTLAAQEW